MLSKVIHNIARHVASKAHEGFNNNDDTTTSEEAAYSAAASAQSGTYMFATIAAFVIVLIIIAFVGKFLWNECIAGSQGLFTIARPATSAWQILGLYIFVALMVGA